ncbi:hypothetical protein ACIBHX_48535 [Nonomuraea sp. NPDC050536]|uniref:hypothetical protein n=1 Tax=Nonomuraea sp. NPDC050536 TaxID=3364366 RepID=UPI0037CC827C
MYSLDERDRRWALARDLMDEEGVEAVVAYGGPADSYLSDAGGPIVLLPRHGDPVCLSDAPLGGAWVTDVRPARHAYGLAEAVRDKGLAQAPIGVLGLDGVPYPIWETVLRQLPQAAFRSVWPGFLRRAMPQSAEEIEVVRRGAALGSAIPGDEVSFVYGFRETYHVAARESPVARRVYEAGLAALRPGARFGEAAQAMTNALENERCDGPMLLGLNPRGAVGADPSRPPVGHDLEIVAGMTFALRVVCGGGALGGTVLVTALGTCPIPPDRRLP